jgi:hypothetical protein
MYDIKELEQKWVKYKLKNISHFIVYVAGFVIAVASSFVAYQYYLDYQKEQKLIAKRAEERRLAMLKKAKEQEARAKAQAKAQQFQNEPPVQKDIPSPEEVASIKPEKRKHIRQKIDILVSSEPIDGDSISSPTNGIEFGDGTKVSRSLIKTIETRFQNTKDYDDAMFLAKYYYSQHQFKKSEYWAMQANLIDSSKDESWIFFSKSKAKQGKRADALRVLQAYFDRTGSMKIKKLIDKIRKGKKF